MTGFGGPEMAILVGKLEAQGCPNFFLQGSFQRKFGMPKVTKFYANRVENRLIFSTTM